MDLVLPGLSLLPLLHFIHRNASIVLLTDISIHLETKLTAMSLEHALNAWIPLPTLNRTKLSILSWQKAFEWAELLTDVNLFGNIFVALQFFLLEKFNGNES